MRHLRTARAAALVALLGLTAVACGGDDTGSADSASATTAAAGASTTAANASKLPTIAKPWARATADSAKSRISRSASDAGITRWKKPKR